MERNARELTTMLAIGAVTPRSARIWVRTDRPGPHHLVLDAEGAPPLHADVLVPDGPADRTAAWTYPDELGGAPLAPDTTYRVRVFRQRTVIAEGRLRTAPEPRATGRLTFAVASCHQPFDIDGRVRPGSRRMLEAAAEALEARDAAFLLAMGDQIYADMPASRSLFTPAHFARVGPPGKASIFACTRAEIRALYQQRYRMSWAIPELQRIYARQPCWPMLDDHEVVDNLGSAPEHDEPAWERVRAGALDAYHDYQGARVLPTAPGTRPAAFDHGFRWGPVAVYLVARVAGHKLGTDRWSYRNGCRRCTAARSGRGIRARGGAGCGAGGRARDDSDRTAFELRWSASGRVVHQLTSSPLTYRESWLTRVLDELAPAVFRHVSYAGIDGAVRLLDADLGAPGQNPYAGLNIGFVHVDAAPGRTRVQLELVGASELGEPCTVYRSPWLGSHVRT